MNGYHEDTGKDDVSPHDDDVCPTGGHINIRTVVSSSSYCSVCLCSKIRSILGARGGGGSAHIYVYIQNKITSPAQRTGFLSSFTLPLSLTHSSVESAVKNWVKLTGPQTLVALAAVCNVHIGSILLS